MIGVPSKEGGILMGGVTYDRVVMRLKTTAQISRSDAFLIISRTSGR